MDRRKRGEPVAYITGKREFWSLMLRIDNRALIPRPETECLVEAAVQRLTVAQPRVLDLGTGCGAVALAIAKTRPSAHIVGVDRDPRCVELARDNAFRLGIPVQFETSDWFTSVRGPFDMIVANPPYVAENDPHLGQGDLRFEPRTALIGGPDGLTELRAIVGEAPSHLDTNGWLLVEHGHTQGDCVRQLFDESGFEGVVTAADLGKNPRVTLGRRPCTTV